MTSKSSEVGSNEPTEVGSYPGKLDAYFRQQEATKVDILIWGPGSHQGELYEKRQKIVTDLRAMSRYNSVFTSEDLIERDARLRTLPLYKAEELQIDMADVVISLWVEASGVSGPPGEWLLFGQRDNLQAKIRLLRPANWKPPDFVSRVATERADDILPQAQCFAYSKRQFQTCRDIRTRCRAWVEAVRAAKYQRLLREHA